MSQQHLDRLTAVDASFLVQEGADTHMHVGAVLIFEDPPPAYDDQPLKDQDEWGDLASLRRAVALS